MPLLLDQSRKKQQELYLRCLSSICRPSSFLNHYYVHYEYNRVDRFLYKRSLKNTLKKWGIKNATDYGNTLRFLLEEGTRQEYNRVSLELTSLPFGVRKNMWEHIERSVPLEEEQKNDGILAGAFNYIIYEKLLNTHSYYAQLYITNHGLHSVPKGGIAAFDVAWCIYLCRIGRGLGYLTEELAMKFMKEAVQLAMKSYSNWHDYFQGYTVGCSFNRTIETYQALIKKGHTADSRDYISDIFSRYSSPLYKFPWRNGLFNEPNQEKPL